MDPLQRKCRCGHTVGMHRVDGSCSQCNCKKELLMAKKMKSKTQKSSKRANKKVELVKPLCICEHNRSSHVTDTGKCKICICPHFVVAIPVCQCGHIQVSHEDDGNGACGVGGCLCPSWAHGGDHYPL